MITRAPVPSDTGFHATPEPLMDELLIVAVDEAEVEAPVLEESLLEPQAAKPRREINIIKCFMMCFLIT